MLNIRNVIKIISVRNFLKKYSNTVGERSEIDDIAAIALVMQRTFGLYWQILDPQWTWRKYCLHQVLNVFLFVYVFFGTFHVLQATQDPEIIVEACYTLIMIVIFPIKMMLYINNRHNFRKLYATAKSTLMDTVKEESEQNAKRVLQIATKTVYGLFTMVLIPISIYEFTTLWNYLNGNRTLLSRSTTSLMPVSTPYFEFAWFLHTLFLLEVSSTIILDMWFVLLIFFLCQASDSFLKVIKVKARNKHESNSKYSTRLKEALRKFHTIHIRLNDYLALLRIMYKWLAFVPLCNAAMCSCLILLVMSKDINWRFAPHMLPMFAEIFAYNWFGEQIKTKAAQINTALLNFDWTYLNMKDKKCYHIILMYMQKDFGINTAVGIDLSLITMSAVLKVTYQAFTVLRTIDIKTN